MFGDSHYKTFDGKMYDYQGQCEHVILSDLCQNGFTKTENIRITVGLTSCGSMGVTCTREVTALIYGATFKMLKGDKKILVQTPENFEDFHFKIFKHAGIYVQIVSSYGVSLLWDNGTRLYISVQPFFEKKLCGLCGNYDGAESNDFYTRQGDIAGNPITFGHSWVNDESCPLAHEIVDTCQIRLHRHDPAKHECAIIKSDLFKACHHLVDPTYFYDKCVFDVCGCDGVGDCDCLCSAIAAYAKECLDEGVAVNWKKGHRICGKFLKSFSCYILLFDFCFL